MSRFRCIAALALGMTALQAFGATDDRATEPAWYVSVQTYSFHEHTSEVELHNTTPGVGVIRRQDDWLAGLGVFRNSLGRWAGYAYGGYQVPFGPVLVGGIAGVTHHYNVNNGGIVPLAAAVVSIPLGEKFMVELVGIPRVSNYTYTTLNVSLSWRFR
jgi:hypothetical protein